MKFCYAVKFSTELHVLHHIKPDYNAAGSGLGYLNRQVLPLPTMTLKSPATSYVVPCMPFEIKSAN